MTTSHKNSKTTMSVSSRFTLVAALVGAAVALMAGAYVETASLALPGHFV